ncbi:MAG: prepilin-type cleavage/methylation domain-containing protein [Opitutaceae bacterium]|nr:prepilin-type cleavage/methylation domain-containing protein [Opitutaceae bacterium]
MLAVITIIGILAAILIPVAGKVRTSARRTEAASNVRQLITGLLLYASDHKQMLPTAIPQKEVSRLQTLYDDGYIRDTRVFINPFNAAGGRRGLGQNVFGGNRDCYFSANHLIYTAWVAGPKFANTYTRVGEGTEIPVVWDQRADNEASASNQMKTADGRFGGYFGYIDGAVKLIGKPDPVVRGQ